MVKKIHIVRKSRRRSRRRSRRKSKKNKKSNRRSRRKSNTKKLKGGAFAARTHASLLRQDLTAHDEEGDIIMILKEYLIPHGGIGKPEVIQETSYSMSLEEQGDILKLLQQETQISPSDDNDRDE